MRRRKKKLEIKLLEVNNLCISLYISNYLINYKQIVYDNCKILFTVHKNEIQLQNLICIFVNMTSENYARHHISPALKRYHLLKNYVGEREKEAKCHTLTHIKNVNLILNSLKRIRQRRVKCELNLCKFKLLAGESHEKPNIFKILTTCWDSAATVISWWLKDTNTNSSPIYKTMHIYIFSNHFYMIFFYELLICLFH